MRRGLAVAAAAAVAGGAGLAGQAIGQGTGGTVGDGATGRLEVQIRLSMASKTREGINPAVPRNKKRPKVADLLAANADALIDGKVVGRAHHTEITTFEGARRYKGKSVAIWRDMLDLGSDDLIFNECKAEDSPSNNSCAITGGTGRFAGARGTAVFDFSKAVEDKKAKTVTFTVRYTFIP